MGNEDWYLECRPLPCGCSPQLPSLSQDLKSFYEMYFGYLIGVNQPKKSGNDVECQCINPESKEKEHKPQLDYSVNIMSNEERATFKAFLKKHLNENKMVTLRDIEHYFGKSYLTKNAERYIWFGELLHEILINPNAETPCKLYFKPCTYVERKD